MARMAFDPVRSAMASVLSFGARALDEAAETVRPPLGVGHRTLVLGGARSGKSRHAEKLLSGHDEVIYVATGRPTDGSDAEWEERIAAHRKRRPDGWLTVETVDIASVLRDADCPVLIDGLSTWLTRLCDHAGAWQNAPGWQERTEEQISHVLDAWQSAVVPAVAVSDEVGSGIVPETPAGRLFRDALGTLNQRVAAASSSVVLVVAGKPVELG